MQTDAELMQKVSEFSRLGGDVFYYEPWAKLALKYAIFMGNWQGYVWQDLMRDVFRDDPRVATQIARLEQIDRSTVPNLMPHQWLRLFSLLQPRYTLHQGTIILSKKPKGKAERYCAFEAKMQALGQQKNSFSLFLLAHMKQSAAEELLMRDDSFKRFDVDYLTMQHKILPELQAFRNTTEGASELPKLLSLTTVDFSRLAPEIQAEYTRKVDITVSPVKVTKAQLQKEIGYLVPKHKAVLAQAHEERNPELVADAGLLAAKLNSNFGAWSKTELIRTQKVMREQIDTLREIRMPEEQLLAREKQAVQALQRNAQDLIRTLNFPAYYESKPASDPVGKRQPDVSHLDARELQSYRSILESDIEILKRFQLS